jgi:hypothetical protein
LKSSIRRSDERHGLNGNGSRLRGLYSSGIEIVSEI